MRGVGLMELSKRMQSLVKLRYLAITINAKHLKKIRAGCWSSLQFLGIFNCDNLECLFEGLQYLESLRTLQVGGCSQLVSLPRSLKFLTKLEHLAVILCGAINLQMELDDDHDLNLSLKTLTLWRLDALTDLPRLLLEGSARSLQVIRIDTCFNIEKLPKWLPNLISLEKLELIDCPNLSNFPKGRNGSSHQASTTENSRLSEVGATDTNEIGLRLHTSKRLMQ
ncbi:hypothetical protein COLO4_36046 [Corchorus olitorius]|uniref:Disease resistance protein At4g27190-like leucine-rich repeats domain-containing protein n=1 Tax=Corchorus olitorius TaxID=93759 RepID=A0A1R3GB61_9ROSI|nr:hypothetical protein COLO4_36046 [Corchorus olitorius]